MGNSLSGIHKFKNCLQCTTQEQDHGGFHTYRSSFHTRIPSHDLSETLVCWPMITFIFSLHFCVDLKYFYKPFIYYYYSIGSKNPFVKDPNLNLSNNLYAICLHFSRKLTCQRRNSPLLKYTSTSTAMDNLLQKETAPNSFKSADIYFCCAHTREY